MNDIEITSFAAMAASADYATHDCPTCGAEHDGADNNCPECEYGVCCATYPGLRLDPEEEAAPVDDLHRECFKVAQRVRLTLADTARQLSQAQRGLEDAGNTAAYQAEMREEAEGALAQAEARFEAEVYSQLQIETYLDYGDRPEDHGLVDAIAAVRRRDRIRTALVVGPAAALIGAAAALAAVLTG